MRKISLLLAMIALLAGGTIHAQKSRRNAPPVREYPLITVLDEATGNFMSINPNTGDYKCVLCEYNGYVIYGKGEVKINGCSIDMADVRPDYQMVVSINTCDQVAKARLEAVMPDMGTMQENFYDSNLRDSVPECGIVAPPPPPPPPPPPADPGLINIQSDADGSFLIFSTLTGEFKFYHCADGASIGGVGLVKIDGCNVYFEALQKTYRIVASVNVCDQAGKAAVEMYGAAGAVIMQEFMNDGNLLDNTTQCGAKH
jgi:hypothetical protein